MRRVKQRKYEAGDCGIACAAMVAGCTYDLAHRAAADLGLIRNGKYFTSHAQIERLLGRLGVKCERLRFKSMRKIAATAIVKVNPRQSGRYWHWVVITQRAGEPVLLDPNPARPGSIKSFRGYKGGGVYLRAA